MAGEVLPEAARDNHYHHFSMDSSNPGVVTARRYVDSKQETFELLKKNVDYSALLDGSILLKEVTPAGLSPERQWYLYDKIREHILFYGWIFSGSIQIVSSYMYLTKGQDNKWHLSRQRFIGAVSITDHNNFLLLYIFKIFHGNIGTTVWCNLEINNRYRAADP